INGLPAPCFCALPGIAQHHDPVPAVSSGHSETPIVIRNLCARSSDPDHVITDWPISDHMQK
ncbi:unnamed protein product, partial [Staurois parvus]